MFSFFASEYDFRMFELSNWPSKYEIIISYNSVSPLRLLYNKLYRMAINEGAMETARAAIWCEINYLIQSLKKKKPFGHEHCLLTTSRKTLLIIFFIIFNKPLNFQNWVIGKNEVEYGGGMGKWKSGIWRIQKLLTKSIRRFLINLIHPYIR